MFWIIISYSMTRKLILYKLNITKSSSQFFSASLIRTVIGGAQIIDLMFLVIDAGKGMQTQTAECLILVFFASLSLTSSSLKRCMSLKVITPVTHLIINQWSILTEVLPNMECIFHCRQILTKMLNVFFLGWDHLLKDDRRAQQGGHIFGRGSREGDWKGKSLPVNPFNVHLWEMFLLNRLQWNDISSGSISTQLCFFVFRFSL